MTPPASPRGPARLTGHWDETLGTDSVAQVNRAFSLPVRLTGWRGDLLLLLSGALSAAALPPVHAVPVLLLTIPCLLTSLTAAPGGWGAFRRGWWFGFGLYLIGLYWITDAILIEAAHYWWLVPLAVPALSAVLALFIGAATALARLAPAGWMRALALAGAWTLTDLARQFVATGFPWNPLGSVWAVPGPIGDVLIQPAAWIGVPGLTLVTVLLTTVPTLSRRWRVAGLTVFALWIAGGVVRTTRPLAAEPSGHAVVVVQGNVAQGQKWNPARAMETFDRYLTLTAAALRRTGPGTAIVVWPETAVPYQLETDAAARAAIGSILGHAVALVGGVRIGADGRPRNSLFAITGDGRISQTFDKWHLVPFGEYQPDWLPIGVQLVPGGGFAPGPGPITLDPPGIPPVGPLICYEAIFPGQVVDPAHRPAWLANVTNDAWFGDSSGPRQHLAAARMRAVEEGLPLIRAANTGISAIFDARGHEIARIAMGRTGALEANLPPPLPPTFFARLGLFIPGFLAVAAVASGILPGLMKGWPNKKR